MNKKLSKNNILLLVSAIFSILLIIFVNNNDFIYKTTILKITKVEVIEEDYDYNDLGIKEKIYKDKITGIITNGKNKNTIKTYINERTYSNVVTEKYSVGDKVFIKNGDIDGFKRDTYLIYILVAFIIALIIIGNFRGLLIVISVIFNIIILTILLKLYYKRINFTILTLLISIIYTITSLIVAAGYNKKTLIAVLSVFVCELFLFLLLELLAITTNFKGIDFQTMSYLTVPPESIFIESLLLGCLGAIMDVSITMSSSISELLETNKKITKNNLIKSAKQIGSDIMPTMINVLFFTYFSSELPLFVLAIRNGFTVSNFINSFYTLEITRFLSGSIGIVLTIPLSIYIALYIYRGEKIK